MKFGSVCSGIEAASVAWGSLGWKAAWLSEIEPFPSAVLAHHYPDVPNLGDMTTLAERIAGRQIEAPDVFCGGTPCQAFSVAGLRQSLDDARGNLSLTFCEIADEIDTVRNATGLPPAVIFWENVPGVLNTKDNAFGCFLGKLAGESEELQPAGGKWTNAGVVLGPQRAVAWRVLDAQYFGLAQRRRRVFVVASARAGFDPAAILFEFDGVRRDTAPSREKGQEVTPTIRAGAANGGPWHGARSGDSRDELIVPVTFAENSRNELKLEGGDGSRTGALSTGGGKPGQGAPMVAFGIPGNWIGRKPENGGNAVEPMHDIAPCLTKADQHGVAHMPAIAFHPTQDPITSTDGTTHGLSCGSSNGQASVAVAAYTTKLHNTASNQAGKIYEEYSTSLDCSSPPPALLTAMQVRRLTPIECERLQDFPDNYTAIPWRKKPASECPDGPRYKALGNSWAVPVVTWIGSRIDAHVRALEHANDNNAAAGGEVAA